MKMTISVVLSLAALVAPSLGDAATSASRPSNQLRARIFLLDSEVTGNKRPAEVSASESFYDGQRFRLKVDSNQDGHLYVLCFTSQKEWKLLYPRREHDNFLTAGETQTLPERGWFRFDQEPGTEKIIFFQSKRPVDFLDEAAEQNSDPEPSDVQRLLKSIDRTGKGIETDSSKSSFPILKLNLRHESRP